jgi:electron transport complex protein RnfE
MILDEINRGIVPENPILVLALGLCPSLAVSTSLENAVGMGLSATVVLMASNLIISMIKGFIPDKVRIPCFIVVIAAFVTMVQLALEAYLPALNKKLGIFVPLIVVNCIILGRAEAYASKNSPFKSLIDGLVMGLGFTVSLCILGTIREIVGSNKLWGFNVVPGFQPMTVFILAPGGFFTIALVMALIRRIGSRRAAV